MLMANRFGHRVPKIYGYSAHLVPTPRDWDSSNHVTGQWFLPQSADFEPPADLVRFLSAGEPPVAVGFGSISGRTPERTTQAVMQALVMAGCRAVIVGGWGGLAAVQNSERVHYVRSVPYDWLLPRVAAVVHHGGAGSTGETLRAGKPAVVCPFFGDQAFWGRRVAAVGAGPEPIPQRQLTPESLAGALRVVLADPGMRRRAEELGARVRAEEGVKAAVSVIQRELGARQAASH
jgi:sterol 3beta-glucosyltransferase